MSDTITKPNITAYPAPPAEATPTDLKAEGAKAITAALNPLIATAFALYVKTKNFHWHLSGSHFREYHLMLDEQADDIFESIDVIAERVRRIGGTTIRSISHIASLQQIADDNDEFVSPPQMIRRLQEDNKNYTAQLRAAHQVCDDNKDVASTSFLEVIIDQTERRTWFLYETMRGGENEN